MAWKVDALHHQVATPRGVQVEHAQRDRQSLAPLADRNDVGVARVVVGQHVAGESEIARHRLGEGLFGRFLLQPGGQPLGGLGGHLSRIVGIARGILVDGAEQRRLEQRKAVVGNVPEFGQRALGFLAGHRSRALLNGRRRHAMRLEHVEATIAARSQLSLNARSPSASSAVATPAGDPPA